MAAKKPRLMPIFSRNTDPDRRQFFVVTKTRFLGVHRLEVIAPRHDVQGLEFGFDRNSKLNAFADVYGMPMIYVVRAKSSRVSAIDPAGIDRRLWRVALPAAANKKLLGNNGLFFVNPSPLDDTSNAALFITDPSGKDIIQAVTLLRV